MLSLVILIPFAVILFNSLKTSQEALNMSLSLPEVPHWEKLRGGMECGNIAQSYLTA